jgi:hypothetical protein
MRRLLLVLLMALCVGGGVHWWRTRALSPTAGVLIGEAPQQVDLAPGAQLTRDDYTLTTRARFELTARVLARADYRFDAGAALAPVDLALGWGRMSDSAVLARIHVSQSNRFYYWRVEDFPIPRQEIENSSANMHLIPADASVLRQIERARVGQLLRLRGFLVDAARADGWQWRTSLRRDDTGSGACELVYVEDISLIEAD